MLEHPVRCERFGDVKTGYALQWDDFRELGELIRHHEDEVVSSIHLRQRTSLSSIHVSEV